MGEGCVLCVGYESTHIIVCSNTMEPDQTGIWALLSVLNLFILENNRIIFVCPIELSVCNFCTPTGEITIDRRVVAAFGFRNRRAQYESKEDAFFT